MSYVLRFVFLGIYWNNHHHLLQAIKHVDGRALWANMHLLFWLSLIPFVTAWMGQNRFDAQPVALYGIVMLLSAVAYFILTRALLEVVLGRVPFLGSGRRERELVRFRVRFVSVDDHLNQWKVLFVMPNLCHCDGAL